MITVNDQRLTNQLLIDELDLWGLFDSKSIDDDKTKQYYQLIDDLLDSQIGESIAWLQSDDAKEYFFEQVGLQKEIFDALEKSWDDILENSYPSVDELLDNIYEVGKEKGYSNIRESLRYTDADKEAIRIAKDYNFHLLRKLDNDLRGTVKNKILQGIITGENPYNLARTLVDAGVQQLDGSTFTPRQRATMIAKTETSRMQNTGMLQSYINEGYTEVKILTAEDDHVCTTCLEYAYNFNNGEPRIFSPELLEREKIHNIIKLIKGGLFPPFHPNCYMPDTQVFTNHGWKYFYDITKDDKILSLNPETKTTEFLDYVKVIAHENTQGYMYHIYNKWFDTCVTSDHDCFIYQRKEVKGKRIKSPEFRKPDELNSESYFLRTIENENESPEYVDINGLKFKSSDYAFFMAWYLSEGSVLHNSESAKLHAYPIKISQEIQSNREILENELKRICAYLGLKVAVGKTYFEIYSKELYDYLQPLGYCHEMYVPDELFGLNQIDLKLFLENYILGDGHSRKSNNDLVTNSYENTIVTSSMNLVNDLSYIILLAGYYPSISLQSLKGTVTKHHNGEYASNHDVYCLRVNRSNFTQFSNCAVDKIPYNGMVYCVELPKYHTLWTRRNGKTSWNGNCRCTYLTVWKSKTDPPKNPYVINLTPDNYLSDYVMKKFYDEFSDTNQTGVDDSKWNQDNIQNSLKSFVDKNDNLEMLSNNIFEFIQVAKSHANECVIASDRRFNVFGIIKGDDATSIEVPKEYIENVKNSYFGLTGHSHPVSKMPLPDLDDINYGLVTLNSKYNIIYAPEFGVMLIKKSEPNVKLNKKNLEDSYKKANDKRKDYVNDNIAWASDEYKKDNINNFNYFQMENDLDEIKDKVRHSNFKEQCEFFNEEFNQFGIEFIYISP